MEKIIKRTQRKFITIIVLVVVFVVSGSWAILQAYNQQEIGSPASVSEVHSLADKNDAYAEYLAEQSEYQAHFVALASSIKDQESDRITSALALTSVIMIIAGALVAYLAARRLIRPVTDAYESQERFVQDAAHELRNPLAAMTIALQQAEKDGQKSPLITTFRRQTKRLIGINEDLLFLERQSKQQPVVLNLSELLGDIVEEVQPFAARKKITIDLQTDNNITKTMASSDYVRMAKNIIDNAVKYSYADSIVTIRQTKEKSHIKLVVTDTGIGIPAKDMAEVGSRFFRASNIGKINGTGLGLAIVTKILNIYGGNYSIDSTPKKGTTVSITL